MIYSDYVRKVQTLKDRQKKFILIDLYELSESEENLVSLFNKINPDNKEKFKHARYFVYAEDDYPHPEYYFYKTYEELVNDFAGFEMFAKTSRSTWRYWFAHWCAFQMTAINLGMWRPKYLFHDIEKPFLLSMLKDYSKVQQKHREHNSHHTEYGLIHGWNKMDWEAAVIDWECSRFTKRDAQMTARETLNKLVEKPKWKPYESIIRDHIEPILAKHCL